MQNKISPALDSEVDFCKTVFVKKTGRKVILSMVQIWIMMCATDLLYFAKQIRKRCFDGCFFNISKRFNDFWGHLFEILKVIHSLCPLTGL